MCFPPFVFFPIIIIQLWEPRGSFSFYTIIWTLSIFNQDDQESILQHYTGKPKSFTEVINEKILSYKGKSEEELIEIFKIKGKKNSKHIRNLIVREILGLTGDLDKTQEFQKANMNLSVICVNQDSLPEWDSPFKNFQFKELAENGVWEDSHVYQEIYDKKFLFVVFREDENHIKVLDNVKFWGVPERLCDEMQRVWQETRDIINNGVDLTVDKNRVSTNFPTKKVNKILFTKIHASNSYYEITKNEFIGKGSLKDTDILLDGRRITKHSFWFSRNFIQEVLQGKWD